MVNLTISKSDFENAAVRSFSLDGVGEADALFLVDSSSSMFLCVASPLDILKYGEDPGESIYRTSSFRQVFKDSSKAESFTAKLVSDLKTLEGALSDFSSGETVIQDSGNVSGPFDFDYPGSLPYVFDRNLWARTDWSRSKYVPNELSVHSRAPLAEDTVEDTSPDIKGAHI